MKYHLSLGCVRACRSCLCSATTPSHLDSAEIHGFLDDLMIITKIQGFRIYWLQEGPCISLEGVQDKNGH